MHDDRFDDELKSRLGHYTEEPDDALWQGIAANISSTPAGVGWLRWLSRGFLMSFAVVTVLVGDSWFMVQGSKFKVQGSRLETGESALSRGENSKFKIQDSKLEVDRPELIAGLEDLKPGVQGSRTGYGDEGIECGDVETRGRDSKLAGQRIQGSRLKTDDAKVVDRRVKMSGDISKIDARRSEREGRREKVKVPGSGLERGDSKAVARRSRRSGDEGSKFEIRRSKAEEERLKFRPQGLKLEEADPRIAARRSRASGDDRNLEVQRSALEEEKFKVQTRGSKPEDSDLNSGAPGLKVEGGEEVVGDGRSKTNAEYLKTGVASSGAEMRVSGSQAALEMPSDEGMTGVFGPPLLMRNDTVPRGQQTMKRTPVAEVAQVPAADSTTEVVYPLLKRRIARAEARKKEDEEHNDKPLRRTSLYFTAMPTLGYQRIEANPADNIIVESFQKVSNFSSKRLGVRAEFGAEYALTPRVRVFGGVLYYQRKQTINYVERVNTGVKQHTSGDTLTLDPQFSLENKAFDYELKNIGVQLGVNYVLWKKKFLHVAGTGIEFHKALNKLSEAQKLQGFSTNPSTYVFYNLYYRVQYPAEGRLKAIFQPTLNYSLFLNRNMNAPFYVKPYGLGLNLGLTYNF